MAAELIGGFKVTSKESIDIRLVLTKEEMKTEKYAVDGKGIAIPNNYFCLCSTDDKIYVFNSMNSSDTPTGRFRLLTTGSSIDQYIKSAVINEEGKLILTDEHDDDIVFSLKTLNGESLVGEGDIKVKTVDSYTDLSGETAVNLSELVDGGVYKITHAMDNPEDTTEDGYLIVKELETTLDGGGKKIEQTWYSSSNFAHRVLEGDSPIPPIEEGFYVNDQKVEPGAEGTIILESGSIYHLRGDLEGQVVIHEAGELVKNFTTIILDGVNITTAKDFAIYSGGEEARLIIEITEGKENNLTSNLIGELSSTGLIHSESDLYLNGTGSLKLVSKSGHGIKGKDILVSGKPNIYIDAEHDGIHGKSLQVSEGIYYIKNANDAFSAGTSNNDGLLKISGGEITVEHCKENVFQAKNADTPDIGGRIRIYYDTKITLLDGFSTDDICSAQSIEVYPTVTINKPSEVEVPIVDIATKFGEATVYDNDNRVPVSPVDGVFTLTSASSSYDVTGNFTGYRIVVPNAGKSLNLNGVWLDDTSDDDSAFIDYTFNEGTDLKNVKLVLSNGINESSINYLKKKNGYIVRSTNNVNINDGALGSADIYMSCTNGYALKCGNEARIQNDGARYFVNSRIGIEAALVNCADELAAEGYDKTKTAMIYVDNNTEYDIGIFYHKYKGNPLAPRVNICANCYCGTYLGKVVELEPKEPKSEGIYAAVFSEEHQVNPSSTSPFVRYPFAYVYDNDTNVAKEGKGIIILGGSPTPPPAVDWKVYCGITQEELDARYVLRTDYIAKINEIEERLRALEDTALNPELNENGNLTLYNTAIDEFGNIDLLRSTIDDDGNVILK